MKKTKKRGAVVEALRDAIKAQREPKPAKRQPKPAKAEPKVKTAPPAAKATSSSRAGKADDPRIATAFASWQAGAQISTLATETGVKRSKLRRLFIALAGGKPKFQALRETGAGGSVEPFGGKRAVRQAGVSVVASIDDSKVPRIMRAPTSEGWTWRRLRPHSDDLVFVSPEGVEFVRALPSQEAHLVYDGTRQHGLASIRLRKLDGSKIAKRERKEQKTLERGEAAIERTRTRKRKAKLARRKQVQS